MIDAARGIAESTAVALSKGADRLAWWKELGTVLGILVAGAIPSGGLPAVLGSWLEGIAWLPPWVKAGIIRMLVPLAVAISVTIGVVWLELKALQFAFEDESANPDQFWMNVNTFRGFRNQVLGIAVAMNLLLFVLGGAIAVVGFENPLLLGFGVGVMAGMLLSLFGILGIIKQSFDDQERDLGYMS